MNTPMVLPASTILGYGVRNLEGEDLGDIEDVAVDTERGCIAYAVLSFGGFLGMGDKLFAIPWNALRLDTRAKQFILDVDKEQLEEAPGFDKDNWPDMSNQEWGRSISEFYGVEPYWTTPAPMAGKAGSAGQRREGY